MTALGRIKLSRLHLVCIQCRDSVQPLDDRIGLTDSLTREARRLLCLAGASWSFDTASARLQEFCGIEASHEYIRKVSEAAGQKMTQWMEQSPVATEDFPKATGEVEFETDATKVNTLEGWKDMKIAIFAKREPGEPVETAKWDDRKLPAPTAWFAFSRIEESTSFAANWGSTAQRLGIDPLSGKLTILGDGADWIWNRTSEQFPGSTGVLDIYHALEYVCDGAKLIFGEGTPLTQEYSDRGRELLLSDGYVGITQWVGEMLGATPMGGDGASLGGVLNYLAGHKERLNYAVRLYRGQSIGSGMVEGAAKNMIGRRLKANNAEWTVDNVGKMAGLCSGMYSGCWDRFWEQN